VDLMGRILNILYPREIKGVSAMKYGRGVLNPLTIIYWICNI
jgi:hypothetical protein